VRGQVSLLDSRTRQRGYFNTEYIERLWREHVRGRHVWTEHLWALLNFELWDRVYLDRESMTTGLKIAHVTTVDSTLLMLLNQLVSLRGTGYHVMGISAPGPAIGPLEAVGVGHIPVPMTRRLTPLADLASLWHLYRVMRREHFTIVHTHTPKAGLIGQLAARLAGVPVIVNTVHGYYFHEHMHPIARHFYIALEKIASRCSDVILSQTAEDIQTAVTEGICQPQKLKFLGNGIDLKLFDPQRISAADELRCRQQLGIAPDAPVVGFVGRLAARRKGFRDFLVAAKGIALQRPDVRFLIAGNADSGKSDAMQPSAAAYYGIAHHCAFVGSRNIEEMPLVYKLMNVLVLPSLFEGIPRAVMEASAMGIPSVVTDVKGNREAVEQGRNGLLVPLGDVQALTSAILRILQEPEMAKRMSSEAQQIAAQRFDEGIVFEKIKSEYACSLRAKGLILHSPSSTEIDNSPRGGNPVGETLLN
jgi:glycosyltransferase involved in cell wall biosynthesis